MSKPEEEVMALGLDKLLTSLVTITEEMEQHMKKIHEIQRRTEEQREKKELLNKKNFQTNNQTNNQKNFQTKYKVTTITVIKQNTKQDPSPDI